jgi:hypothetical protein
VFLLVAGAALTRLASVLDVSCPFLLVIGGSVIGFMRGVPNAELERDGLERRPAGWILRVGCSTLSARWTRCRVAASVAR